MFVRGQFSQIISEIWIISPQSQQDGQKWIKGSEKSHELFKGFLEKGFREHVFYSICKKFSKRRNTIRKGGEDISRLEESYIDKVHRKVT